MGRILKRVWSATVRATCTELPRFAPLDGLGIQWIWHCRFRGTFDFQRVWSATVRATCTELPRFAPLDGLGIQWIWHCRFRGTFDFQTSWSATVRATCTELPRFAWLEVLQERVEVDALVSQFELQEHFSRQQNEMGRWGQMGGFSIKMVPGGSPAHPRCRGNPNVTFLSWTRSRPGGQ